jgi:cytidylate kinase
MQRAKDVKRRARTGPYISISREAGAGATHVARLVGQRLGWDVLDKELLDFMTQRYKLPRDMLDIVDENRANWFHDMLGGFFDSRVVTQDSYVIHLERITYLAAMHGRVVFVGRGAHLFLPRDNGLAVRIIAQRKMRIEAIMRRANLSQEEAALMTDEVDAARAALCRRHFHQDITDPLGYDLVINASRWSPEAAADLIVDAFHRAQGEGRLTETHGKAG